MSELMFPSLTGSLTGTGGRPSFIFGCFSSISDGNCLCYIVFDLLRTFARKFSNNDFFLKILSLKDDELVMSEI